MSFDCGLMKKRVDSTLSFSPFLFRFLIGWGMKILGRIQWYSCLRRKNVRRVAENQQKIDGKFKHHQIDLPFLVLRKTIFFFRILGFPIELKCFSRNSSWWTREKFFLTQLVWNRDWVGRAFVNLSINIFIDSSFKGKGNDVEISHLNETLSLGNILYAEEILSSVKSNLSRPSICWHTWEIVDWFLHPQSQLYIIQYLRP